MAIGNVSTSSLLSTARSQRNKIRTLEDRQATFEWENSQKTTDDWLAYRALLEERINDSEDAGDLLTYQTRLRSAQRSWFTEELQRESIKIQMGQGTLADKYNRTVDLYSQAVSFGDLNTAQNLLSQINSLDVQLQNEMARAADAFKDQQANRVTNAKEFAKFVTEQEGYFQSWNEEEGVFESKPTLPTINSFFTSPQSEGDSFDALGAEAAELAGAPEGLTISVLNAALDSIEAATQNILAEASQIQDEGQRNELINLANEYQTTKEFDVGGLPLQRNEIAEGLNAHNQGYSMFRTKTTTEGKVALIKDEFARDTVYLQKRREDGNIYYEPTQVFRPSNVPEDITKNVRERLEQLGYGIGEINQGVAEVTKPTGERFDAVVTPSGNLRFTEFGDIKTLDIDTGQLRSDNPLVQERFDEQGGFTGQVAIPQFSTEDEGVEITGFETLDFSGGIGDNSTASLIRDAQRRANEAFEKARAQAVERGGAIIPLRNNSTIPGTNRTLGGRPEVLLLEDNPYAPVNVGSSGPPKGPTYVAPTSRSPGSITSAPRSSILSVLPRARATGERQIIRGNGGATTQVFVDEQGRNQAITLGTF